MVTKHVDSIMMTQREVIKMLQLKPHYDSVHKAEFKRLSRKLLREVAKQLDLTKETYDIRWNEGGIAVSGDATLHHDKFYVMFNLDLCDWVLVRTCNGRKDYTGGPNMSYPFERLADGVEPFVKWLRNAIGL